LHCLSGLVNGGYGIKLKPVGSNTKQRNKNFLLTLRIATNKMTWDFTELNKVVANWAADDNTNYDFHETLYPNKIVLNNKGVEIIRVAEDGFYVRGVRVEADDREAATVYTAFKEFLVWNRLSRE
jgi:hypothetical protein